MSTLLPFKPIDLKAPRRRRGTRTISSRDVYKKLVQKHPKYKNTGKINLLTLVRKFNEALWKKVIEHRDGAELPESLGYIFMGTCPPPKKSNLNRKASSEYGFRLSHRNFESDNYLLKIFYSNFNNKYLFKTRKLWAFEPIRNFKREASKTYREDFKKYIHVDNFTYARQLFDKKVKKLQAIEYIRPIDPTYNEFNLD